jgi:hypothetical protein
MVCFDGNSGQGKEANLSPLRATEEATWFQLEGTPAAPRLPFVRRAGDTNTRIADASGQMIGSKSANCERANGRDRFLATIHSPTQGGRQGKPGEDETPLRRGGNRFQETADLNLQAGGGVRQLPCRPPPASRPACPLLNLR